MTRLDWLLDELKKDEDGTDEAGLCAAQRVHEAMKRAGMRFEDEEFRGQFADELGYSKPMTTSQLTDAKRAIAAGRLDLSKIVEQVTGAIKRGKDRMEALRAEYRAERKREMASSSGKAGKRVGWEQDVDDPENDKHLEDQPKIQQRTITREE